MNQSWSGTIIDPNSDYDNVSELEDKNTISKELYIAKFFEFQQNTDNRVSEVVNAVLNRLRQVRDGCEARYLE